MHEQSLYIMHYANIVYQQCIDSKHMNMQTVLPLDCQVQGNCFNRVVSLGASRDEDLLSLNWNYKLNGTILWVAQVPQNPAQEHPPVGMGSPKLALKIQLLFYFIGFWPKTDLNRSLPGSVPLAWS